MVLAHTAVHCWGQGVSGGAKGNFSQHGGDLLNPKTVVFQIKKGGGEIPNYSVIFVCTLP